MVEEYTPRYKRSKWRVPKEGTVKDYTPEDCKHQVGFDEIYILQETRVELCNACEAVFLSEVNLPSGQMEATDLVEILKATGWRWPVPFDRIERRS